MSGEAVLFEEPADGEGRGDFFEALVYQEEVDSLGAEAGLFSQVQDSALEAYFDVSFGMVRAARAIEQGCAFSLGLGPAFFPLVEGFTRDCQAEAG